MIKEIWCMPHSHLDIGYTHPQPMLLELQKDYLDQALELIGETLDYPEEARFRWTIEGNFVLEKWLETAGVEQEEKLKKYIRNGYIAVTALPVHTTPCADAREMAGMLSGLKNLEDRLGTKIRVALNHDVDGQPWTLGQVLLDAGVDFYLTGINIHYGGLPFRRPAFFQWEMSDGRKLPTFLGEHYSLFNQYGCTWENSTERMHEGLSGHARWLESRGYEKDFMFLTATNPPEQYDNNPPDRSLPDLIRRYNEEGYPYRIRIVTAEMLRDRLYRELEGAPARRGDWTDFWNFGCASTARETRVSRLAKGALNTAEMLECFSGKPSAHYEAARKKCRENMVLYDEHTWGASQSVSEPDSPETYSQRVHKDGMAYQAAELAGYLASVQMKNYCGNPWQSDRREGVLFVNPSGAEVTFEAAYPAEYREEKRLLDANKAKYAIPYLTWPWDRESAGILTLEPFTAAVLSFKELDRLREQSVIYEKTYHYGEGILETPYYKVEIQEATGRIRQVTDKKTGIPLLSREAGLSLFEPVREQIDESQNPAVRETLFGNSVDFRNHDVSQWNHNWKAERTTPVWAEWELEKRDYQILVVTRGALKGTGGITQKITFYTYRPGIRIETEFVKEPVRKPESLLFAVPTGLKEGWGCSYDTAGEIVKLDEEQLGTTCRDYQTVDTAVSLYGEEGCLTLCCPDAPMVQVGDFRFARENRQIERKENPVLLAWPLNNYWSTNFMADQSGKMTFAYELHFHETFRRMEMFRDGIRTKQPVSAGLAVHGPFRRQTLLKVEGELCVLNVYPDRTGKGLIALVKNQEDVPVSGTLYSPEKSVKRGAAVDYAEEEREVLAVENGRARITVPARALLKVRLEFKKSEDI